MDGSEQHLCEKCGALFPSNRDLTFHLSKSHPGETHMNNQTNTEQCGEEESVPSTSNVTDNLSEFDIGNDCFVLKEKNIYF